MVSFEDEGAVSVKIIDLGLAKVIDEAGAQTTISASGALPEHQNSPVRNKSSEERWISVRISTRWGFALADADRSGAISGDRRSDVATSVRCLAA